MIGALALFNLTGLVQPLNLSLNRPVTYSHTPNINSGFINDPQTELNLVDGFYDYRVWDTSHPGKKVRYSYMLASAADEN